MSEISEYENEMDKLISLNELKKSLELYLKFRFILNKSFNKKYKKVIMLDDLYTLISIDIKDWEQYLDNLMKFKKIYSVGYKQELLFDEIHKNNNKFYVIFTSYIYAKPVDNPNNIGYKCISIDRNKVRKTVCFIIACNLKYPEYKDFQETLKSGQKVRQNIFNCFKKLIIDNVNNENMVCKLRGFKYEFSKHNPTCDEIDLIIDCYNDNPLNYYIKMNGNLNLNDETNDCVFVKQKIDYEGLE